MPVSEKRRPRLMTLLTLIMLLVGGRMFFGSVTDLHRLATGKPEILTFDGSLNADQEALLRSQVVLANTLARTRPVALCCSAFARLALGLVYLFAVAAIFSGDSRGRRVSLLAGWMGMAVSAANAFFLVLVVRSMLPRLAPALVDALAGDAERAGRVAPGLDAVAVQARLYLFDLPIAVTGMGMVLSLVLLAYFGSRRMQLFYNPVGQLHG